MYTRNPNIKIQYSWLREESHEVRENLLSEIFKLASSNVYKITKDYLAARMNKYQVLLLAKEKGLLIGFMFCHFYSLKLFLWLLQWVHLCFFAMTFPVTARLVTDWQSTTMDAD